MTSGAQTIGKPVNDGDAEPIIFTFNPVDDGTNGVGGRPLTVNAADLSAALKKQEIHGPRTVDPTDPLTPSGDPNPGNTVIDPNRDIKLTSEPETKNSAIGDYLASLSDKPTIKDASWVGADTTDGGKPQVCMKDADTGKTVCPEQTGKGPPDLNNTKPASEPGMVDYFKCFTNGGTIMTCSPLFNSNGKYVDPEADTSSGGSFLPEIGSVSSGGKTTPSGDALGLGQFKSGSGYDFEAMESQLEKFLGTDASSKSSGWQSGSTGGGTKTVSDGSSGGSSNNVKSAAPSGGASVSPPTGLEALMQKFGLGDFNAHLKDGSFDLDNFSAGAPSTKDPILDLDGNGQQDVIEWALSQLVMEKAEVTIVEELHNNPALAEFHQMMMDKYADVFIA